MIKGIEGSLEIALELKLSCVIFLKPGRIDAGGGGAHEL